MRKIRTKIAVLAILMATVLAIMPLIGAAGIQSLGFSGYLMKVTGTSTNEHFTARYAWLSDGDLAIYVAFEIGKSGTAYDRNIYNLNYNGVDLFSGSQSPQEGTDYWYLKPTLTLNGLGYNSNHGWLVVNFGTQTLTDPLVVGMTVHGGGFSVTGLQVPIDLHTVTYDANGGQGVVTDPNPIYDEGDPVTVMANAFTKADHLFTGWNTKADGTGDSYSPGDVFTMPDHDVVLYAQWERQLLPLTITADSQTKTYGDTFAFTGTEFSVEGLEDGDSVSSVVLNSDGAAANADVGSYDILPSAAIGVGLEKYDIEYVPGTLEITPGTLLITANDDSKVYDGTAYSGGNGVTYAGFVNGEDESVLIGSLGYSGTSQGAVDVGSYGITPGGLTSRNYEIAFAPGNLEITPRAIQVTADSFSKVYGQDDPALTYEITSGELVAGDSFTGALVREAGENVGSYGINQGNLALSSNYTLSFVPGTLEITPGTLVITANDDSKVYDGTAYSGGNGVTYAGFVNGEDESVLIGSLGYSGTSQGAVDVGSYGITPGGLTSGNYEIAFAPGNLEITPRAIQVTADSFSKVYGQDDPALTYEITSGELVAGDSFTGALVREAGENVGSYGINQDNLALSSNYTLSFVPGTLEITPGTLVITANDDSKVYDGTAYSGGNGVTYAGFVNGEDESVLIGSLGYSGTSQGAVDVGSYGITPGGLTSGNYEIAFAPGNLEITPRAIQVTANSFSKVYGQDDPALTYEITSGELVAGDSFTGALVREAGENVGSYGINQGNLALSSNYTLSFTPGTLEITPAQELPKTGGREKSFPTTGFVVMLAGILLAAMAKRLRTKLN